MCHVRRLKADRRNNSAILMNCSHGGVAVEGRLAMVAFQTFDEFRPKVGGAVGSRMEVSGILACCI